jgi:hypothetical protein
MCPTRAMAPLLFALVACSGGHSPVALPPAPEPIAQTCATRLPPRAADDLTPPVAAPFAAPRSTIVVKVEVPLAGIAQALETKVARRVAEEHDHDIGAAGRLEYTVDRGPFTVRVENGTLVVESNLQGRAQACAKGRCYAGCAPEARATARVPLHLGADYKLRSSEVRIDVTKGCQVKALGGLLTIDVTPVLRGALAQQSRSIQASIDRELPDFGGEAARLWTELGKTRPLPLGMCVALRPEEITQGLASGTADLARLRFGLLARPEVRVRCAASGGAGGSIALPAPSAANAARPPPLRDDPALPAAGDVHLAIVLPEDATAHALEGAPEVIDFGGRRARITRATGDVAKGLVVELGGEVCGEIGTSAAGLAWGDAQSLHLTRAAALPADAARLATVLLDATRLTAVIERAPIALPIAVSALQSTLPELARGMSDDKVTVTATVDSAQPESAGLRGAELVATALLRGAVTLRAK